ncbi:hypothetical protein PGT21_027898 [Puccinia graminis f. sp. tritici]|uniref:MULE transposase domain-containing protein n=1 Tax=Puccinia graminis f. sp. tritici TaxID=56615 RepID=A0A5B0PKW4_PUCGR|nr:hypothetical protein PGT21_027898 [Puccinia graminis f. sp. tritici]
MKRSANTSDSTTTDYPLVADIYDVVPLPFTQQIPVQPRSKVIPNSLRMIRSVGASAPSFPTPIHCFTIPGQTREDANAFVTAMQATVYWNSKRSRSNLKALSAPPSGKGRPIEYSFRLEYKCPRNGIHKPVPNSRKNRTLSQKCGCTSGFAIFHHLKTNTLRVEWQWHHNHDPFSAEEMKKNRIPKMVDDWLTDRVISGLSWKAIHQLMWCPDIFAMHSLDVKPEAKYIKYDHVRNLIRTRMGVLAKRNPDPFISITLWRDNLQQQGWNTFLPASHDATNFTFAFQSPWQRQQLLEHGWGMLMLDSTHNSVDNRSLSCGRKFSLYTFVIRDPIVGKGLPVCWAFTASAAAEPIEAIMKWLRGSTGIIPCAIMSDCALAIKKGVNEAYKDLGRQAPKIYWCLFHVLKAFKNRALFFLKKRSDEAVQDFHKIVYGPNPEHQLLSFYDKWTPVNTLFVEYVETQWHVNITHWAVFYRTTPHQGIHTNNYTEAWHRILKNHFIDTRERRRIDKIVQVLTDEVHTSYLMTQTQVAEGIISQRTNQFQSHAKAKADGYTPEIMALLGIEIIQFPAHYYVSSFTNPTTTCYLAHYEGPIGGELGRLKSGG